MKEKDVSIWTVTSVPFFGGLLALAMVVFLNLKLAKEKTGTGLQVEI